MKVLAILGSRNERGQTARAAEALLEGASGEGAETERIFLPPLNLERCRQCDERGWGICRSEGKCVIEDAFETLVEKVRNADVVLFGTPVYFADLSESMRAFLDRLRRTCTHEAAKLIVRGKPAVGVCVAGGGGGGAPACTVSLERVLSTCGFDVVDMVPARRQNLELKRAVLAETGRWLARNSLAEHES